VDTTVRLDESVRRPASAGPLALRWLTPRLSPPWLSLEGARVDVGRGPGVAIVLDAAGLSRRHAELYRQGPATIAHDLGSTNGTHVNGRRVEYAPLSEGDVLRLGDVIGVVVRTAAAAGSSPESAELVAVGADTVFGPGLAEVLDQIRRIAPSDLPVTIVGETGAGKEHVARTVHTLSGRRGRFHAVNCAALPAALAEAELFGHTRGAFTGADHAGLGQVRAADGGTLFLDELAELPHPIQAKLLRVLQERQVTPLGETRPTDVDLRVVAACQRPLDELVGAGRLREDLAARIAGLVVTVTPLRQRRLDVGLLFQHFLERATGGRPPPVDPRLLECLLTYDWPGNVRELELLTRRLIALHGHEPRLRRSFLPEELRAHLPPGDDEPDAGPAAAAAPSSDRDQHDRRRLAEALRDLGGNLTRAAAAAGISRARAYRLMEGRTVPELLAALPPPGDAAAPGTKAPR
jgi:DNA-binding NtrC family response regulator